MKSHCLTTFRIGGINVVLPIFLLTLLISSCRRDDFYTGNDVNLRFSTDTLRFDTVFTKVGSATRQVKIYNPVNQPVLVDIKMINPQSRFRFNADGSPGPEVNLIEINAMDSIYIFVEVTIDPDQPASIMPFILEDQILFEVNGREKILYLEAYGQNANYITGTDKRAVSLLSCNLGEVIWNDPKPYVIYGVLYIDSCQLTLPAGTKVYVHGGIVKDSVNLYNAGLIVCLNKGKIVSQGTVDRPVVIQGDRLEPAYQEVKSQWVGILFSTRSRGNFLTQTTIKNSVIGVQVDSLAELKLNGCRIFNTGNAGIIGRHGFIAADNCLVYNNEAQAVLLRHGGSYQFQYCTFASYGGRVEAVSMNNYYCYEFPCEFAYVNPLDALFVNCIITGNGQDEIGIDYAGERSTLFYKFENCLVKVDEILGQNFHPDFFNYCQDCYNISSNDRLFLNLAKYDFHPDTMSVALGKARTIFVKEDIEGKIRKEPNPDAGCYEL